MTRDFLKPQKIGGLDTNTQAGQRSRFASRPFARIPKPEMSPQDIQTMRERAARAGNPMAKALGIPEPTVQREELPEEEKQENLQMKANESVQQKQEQPELQTLIRQRAARVDTPLQRMMKAKMAQAQSLKQQEEEKLQTKSELTVQREMMPGEEEENLQMQSEPTLQPQELAEEEKQENLEMKANESVQRNVLDGLQVALDVAGLVPLFGFAPDLLNAGISGLRGDTVGAGLSLAAAVPGIGLAAGAGKLGAKGVKAAKGAKAVKGTKGAKETAEKAAKEKAAKNGESDFDDGGRRGGGGRRRGEKKDDIKQIESVSKEFKMTPQQRREFGDFVEEQKAIGRYGTKNERGDFTYQELRELAREFIGQ